MDREREAERDAKDRRLNKAIADVFVQTGGKKPAFESLEQIRGATNEEYFNILWLHLEQDGELLELCLNP